MPELVGHVEVARAVDRDGVGAADHRAADEGYDVWILDGACGGGRREGTGDAEQGRRDPAPATEACGHQGLFSEPRRRVVNRHYWGNRP